jgi:hypothetical protein
MRALAALFAFTFPLAVAAQEAAAPPPPPAAAPAATPAPPPPPPPAWKAQARAGLVSTSGNAETTTVTGGGNVSWSDASNKIGVEGVVAYGESRVAVVNDANGNGVTDGGEIGHRTQETVNNWNVKGRYDRFITKLQGAFVGGTIGADEIAGKTVIGGGFAGWAAKLVKTADQELIAELGYDFSYEEYSRTGVKPVEIHSGRAFLGETLKLNESVGLTASVEGLANLNTEKNALNAHKFRTNPAAKVTAFEDIRVNGKIAITAALRTNVSLAVGFTLKWDRNPAPLPAISGAPPFAPGYVPFAKEVDTITDVALIVSFL